VFDQMTTWETKERGWENVQIKAFTSWLNGYLAQRNMTLTNIKTDLSDGVRLIHFLELLSGKKVSQKYDDRPPTRIQKIQNLHIALVFLEKEMDVRLVGVGAEDFADQNLKMILGFLWSLFKKYRIQTIKHDDKSSEEALLAWCKKMTEGYNDVSIESYKTSFRNGKAFLALCDRYISNPEVLDYNKFSKENAEENLNAAFEYGEKELGIPKLLEAHEVAEGNVDERSLVLYISLYFHAFVAQQQQKGMELEKQKIEEKMRGLEGSLEDRARMAADLQAENIKLKEMLESLKNELKTEQDARVELQEKDSYLEEKVEVLKQLLEQENEEKEELESSRRNLEKDFEDLRTKMTTLMQSQDERGSELSQAKQGLEEEKKNNKDLRDSKASLEQQVTSLQSQLAEIASKLKSESDERKKESEKYSSRAKVELKGIALLKDNLEKHVEDLHRWQNFIDSNSEVDFSGEIRPQILSDITQQNFDEQLQYLAKKLDKENDDLVGILKQKETEAKAKKALEKKKKERASKQKPQKKKRRDLAVLVAEC